MPAIGFVARDENGSVKGNLRMLSIRADGAIVPNTAKTGETQPDYRVLSGDIEIRVGWNRRADQASGRRRSVQGARL